MSNTQIDCSRCGATTDGLERAPLPGELGEQLLAQTCPGCWKDWMDTQVKLMNEGHLTPANPEHYALLVREMTAFLRLQ